MPEFENDVPEWPEGSGYIRRAWQVLRDDRFYGAMGGMSRIYYSSVSRYAADNNIEIEPFYTFLDAIDSIYVTWANDKAKENTTTPNQD